MAEPGQVGANPFINWRRKIDEAGAIVAKPWRRYRASVFQGYLIGAVVVFRIPGEEQSLAGDYTRTLIWQLVET